ncbi:MAG: flagellar hook assembly protein FlgD [Gammaproteobacteria bacterium]|nr:flagellar hook assembly protein FlgD [Gammaproteobacteria bacterium]
MVDSIIPASLSQYQIEQRPTDEKSSELGQDDFLTLMMTQLQHQDPFKPMENGEFLGQMAQFSTVSGIEGMQNSLDNMTGSFGANQTLQASQLIGQSVLVEDSTAHLKTDEMVEGRFELPTSSGSVRIEITDTAGRLVREIELGEKASGRHDFQWDGNDSLGEALPAGQYTIEITAASGDTRIAVPALLSRKVDSVEFGDEGAVQLNTAEGEVITLDQVKQIRQSVVTN